MNIRTAVFYPVLVLLISLIALVPYLQLRAFFQQLHRRNNNNNNNELWMVRRNIIPQQQQQQQVEEKMEPNAALHFHAQSKRKNNFTTVVSPLGDDGDDNKISRSIFNNNNATNNSKPCHWTVLMGDSNTRNIFMHWQRAAKRRSTQSNYNNNNNNSGVYIMASQSQCQSKTHHQRNKSLYIDKKWIDREMIILQHDNSVVPNDCHIVSFKFMNSQHRILGFYQNWSSPTADNDGNNKSSSSCYEQQQQQQQFWTRPNRPHFIWYSHGLWGLPKVGVQDSLNCTERFQNVTQVFMEWTRPAAIDDDNNNNSPKIVWQTLFPINFHPKITSRDIDWDYKCQLETMAQWRNSTSTSTSSSSQRLAHSIQLVDLYKPLRNDTEKIKKFVEPKDYHWNKNGMSFVLSLMQTSVRGTYYYAQSIHV